MLHLPKKKKKLERMKAREPSCYENYLVSCFQCFKEFIQPVPPPFKWSKMPGGNGNICDPLLGEPGTSVALGNDIILEGTQQGMTQTQSEYPKDEIGEDEEE